MTSGSTVLLAAVELDEDEEASEEDDHDEANEDEDEEEEEEEGEENEKETVAVEGDAGTVARRSAQEKRLQVVVGPLGIAMNAGLAATCDLPMTLTNDLKNILIEKQKEEGEDKDKDEERRTK